LAIYFRPETTLVVKAPGSAPGWYATNYGTCSDQGDDDARNPVVEPLLHRSE
jgi:hypothetical protein